MHANFSIVSIKMLLALLACVVSMNTFAVIASPDPITLTQPDGSTVTVKLVGDEFHSYYTRLDGTPIRLNERGFWVNDESVRELAENAQKERRIAQAVQLNATFPLTGSPKSLVILVNFQDVKFSYKLDDYHRMLNTSGYSENNAAGSARDYFIASSDSVFSPQFDCYGPVTVSQNASYYGGNGSGGDNLHHVHQMVVEACNLVANEGVDMTQYDTNNDGRLDNVFIYYAGHNEAEHGGANTIWPHRSVVSSSEYVQGKLIYDYACTSELRGASGNSMCGIGTFCHEFGHVLGLPDYYDTQNDRYTIGTWDIMCSGSYNGSGKTPPTYNAGERFQLGWLIPVQLDEAGPYTLEPLESSNTAYLIAEHKHNLSWEDASPNEYWLLENRQHVGWDEPSTALPGTGMLIWHIDYNPSVWAANAPNNSIPLRFDVEEAYGAKGFSAPSDPFPGTANIMQFTPTLHNGEMLDQPLLNIYETEGQISFTFRASGADRAVGALASLPDKFQERCQLIVAGSGSVSAMRRLVRRLGVADRVRFTAVDEELNDFLLAGDLLLHPARGEAAGTAPLQALCAGLPVLATSSGGWAREIVRADSVLLPAPFHQVELNRTLRMLLSTPQKLEEMAREAVSAAGSFDLERRFEVAADIIAGKGR